MKHVFPVLSVACVAFFTLFLSTTQSSCKKGDTGPKGDTGTANVMYSPWLNLTFGGAITAYGDTVAFDTIVAPKLTQKIIDAGAVKVYVNTGSASSPSVVPLPATDLYGALGFYQINVFYSVGVISLYSESDVSTRTQNGQTVFQYRYVIIPGGVSVSGRSAVNWNNYEAVKKYLNIPD